MNKLLVIGLVCMSFCYVSAEPYPPVPQETPLDIPPASLSLAKARATTNIKIDNEVPLLLRLAIESIKNAVAGGYTMDNPDVTQYHTETIHIVAQQLRAAGYYVKLVNSINGNGQLLVIDWSGTMGK